MKHPFSPLVHFSPWPMAIVSQSISSELFSDLDPDQVGSAFIWVRGSGSGCIKWREKQSLTNQVLGVFHRKLYLSSLNLKK